MKKAVKDFLKDTLIIAIGWWIVLILGGHRIPTFAIGVLTGVILEARQRYASICRENGGELPPRVLDKTDGREIPDATRTPAGTADKSDICKNRGISATKSYRTTTKSHHTRGRQDQQ